MPPSKYNKLLNDNVTKTYKKSTDRLEKSINMEAKHIAKSISLDNRIECQGKTPAFITLKDQKENFRASQPCRLINPCKSELGKVSENILEKANCALIHSLQVNQWKNTDSVITWFSSIEEKRRCTFIQLDIMEYYPSISENILGMAIGFAQEHNIFTEKDLRIIKHCRKSLLYVNNEPWKKKNTKSCFDVTIGSYDGAEICQLVGIYIQFKLAKLIDKKSLGLYRDDGLILLKNTKGREVDQIRKKVIKIFKDVGFKIEIKTNLKIVDFLDVTLNLSNGTYSPYKKPNDQFLYIHTSSNHPPQIINMLPKSINERLSKNSSNPETFDKAKIDYEKALKDSGYKSVNLIFKKPAEKQNRTRSRKIIWFNPPFNKSVTTNVAKRFLNLVDRHFPKTNTLHKIFNRNTVKVSYSCTCQMRNQ